MHVENFRKLRLYDKSLDLCFATYQFVQENQKKIDNVEAQKIRKLAITIPAWIAIAVGQTNMKVRFKLLNKAKDSLLELQKLVTELHEKLPIHYESGFILVCCQDELVKLLHAYFGWLSKNKIISINN